MVAQKSVYQYSRRERRAAIVIQRSWRNFNRALKKQACNLDSFFSQAIQTRVKHSTIFANIPAIGLDKNISIGEGYVKNFLNPRSNIYLKESHILTCGLVSLCRAYYFFRMIHHNISALPKRIVSVGSGYAFWERGFQVLGFDVIASDKELQADTFMSVLKAEMPGDMNKVLPEDCILFSAYPQGYLGPVVEAFSKRGGYIFMCHVEGSASTNISYLNSDMHAGYEPDQGVQLLRETRNLIRDNKNLACLSFDISPNLPNLYSFGQSSIEIFNFPIGDRADLNTRLPNWKDKAQDGVNANLDLTYCIHDKADLSEYLNSNAPDRSEYLGL